MVALTHTNLKKHKKLYNMYSKRNLKITQKNLLLMSVVKTKLQGQGQNQWRVLWGNSSKQGNRQFEGEIR